MPFVRQPDVVVAAADLFLLLARLMILVSPLVSLMMFLPLLMQDDPDVQTAKALRAAFEANDVAGVEDVRRETLNPKP